MIQKKYLLSFIFSLSVVFTIAQTDTIKYDVSLTTITSTGKYSPFWFGARNYGLISTAPTNALASVKILKDFGESQHNVDYKFLINAVSHADNFKKEVLLHELYAGIKVWLFTFSGGFKEEILGNQDSTLSAGGFMYSQNAAPIPKVSLHIERFKPLPNANDIEVKGGVSHGWFNDNVYVQNMLFHHKYLYLRIKYPEQRLWFEFGLDHSVQWAGNFPDGSTTKANFSNFKKVFFGQGGGMESVQSEKINALGNHLVSQSLRVESYVGDFKVNAYWQNLSEDGPIILLWNTMNIRDGVWGLSVKNKDFPYLKGFLYEYISTTDQSGPYHDKDGVIYGGNDWYFHNGIYLTGWTYRGRTLGTPLITSPIYNENYTGGNFSVLNTRVTAHHLGFEGNIIGYDYKLLTTYTKNYGLYINRFPEMKPNTSLLLEINKKFQKLGGFEGKLSLGADFGTLFGNSIGGMVTIRKTGNIFKY
jgi:hypothetical protein